MASFGSRNAARLHKRGHSGSSIPSPPLPPTSEMYPSSYKRGDAKKVTYSDETLEEPNAPALKIRPYLRRLTSKDDTRIDLSRTAAENERLAGLGINDFNGGSRSVSDVTFTPVNARSRHARTTSGNSQYSTNSSLQRPSAPYAHPMRQTPRPYTPPIAKSYTTSMIGSEFSDEMHDVMSDDETRYRQRLFVEHNHSDSIGSLPTHPPPLHLHTNGSFTRLNVSQSSIPSTMPTGTRSRGDTLRSMETIGSPSSRTSMDKAVSFVRGKSTEELDATSRAASIRALRAAYNEKEEAKERRFEKEALKQADREHRKRIKKDERQRRKSDADDARARAHGDSGGNNEKVDFLGKAYKDYNSGQSRPLPEHVPTANFGARSRGNTATSRGSSRKSAKSTWLAFLTWIRTRLLRLGRKLHMTG